MKKRPTWSIAWWLIGLLAMGCAGRIIHVNGIEIYESHWIEAQEQVGQRASFELECPPAQLRFVLFRRVGRSASEVGVEGCGRREVYTRVGTTWFSSGQTQAAQAQQQLLIQQQQMQYQTTIQNN